MTTPPRNLSSLGHGLPEDIVDEILDQLSGEDASLLKYALISRLWLHKTTARFFGSFTVRSRRNVGRLFELQNLLTSSERLPAHIHTLFVEVTPINAATAATLPHHLPWLQSFTLKGLAIDWDFEPSFLPSTGQHLETLTLCILPLSFISCVTRQFASVDTLRVYFATHAGEALAPRGERVGVKRLVVEAVPGHALPVIAALFEPEKLSSIQLDLDGTWSPVSPDDISTFFEVAGGHITELDCTLSGGGWTMPSKRELFSWILLLLALMDMIASHPWPASLCTPENRDNLDAEDPTFFGAPVGRHDCAARFPSPRRTERPVSDVLPHFTQPAGEPADLPGYGRLA